MLQHRPQPLRPGETVWVVQHLVRDSKALFHSLCQRYPSSKAQIQRRLGGLGQRLQGAAAKDAAQLCLAAQQARHCLNVRFQPEVICPQAQQIYCGQRAPLLPGLRVHQLQQRQRRRLIALPEAPPVARRFQHQYRDARLLGKSPRLRCKVILDHIADTAL